MLVVAALLVLQPCAPSCDAAHPMQLRPTSLRLDVVAALPPLPRRRYLEETLRPGWGWRAAPVVAQLADAFTTDRALERARSRGEDLAWPSGEANPLLRGLAHKGGWRLYAVKGGVGVLGALAVELKIRRGDYDGAKRTSRMATLIPAVLATSNGVQLVFSTR